MKNGFECVTGAFLCSVCPCSSENGNRTQENSGTTWERVRRTRRGEQAGNASAGHCTWRADPIHHAETHGKARAFCALCVPADQKSAMSMRIHKPFPRFLARRALRGSAKRPRKDSVSVRVKRRHVMIPHSRGATWTSDAEWSQGGNQRHCETPRKPLAFPWGDAPDPAPFSMRGRYLDVNSHSFSIPCYPLSKSMPPPDIPTF